MSQVLEEFTCLSIPGLLHFKNKQTKSYYICFLVKFLMPGHRTGKVGCTLYMNTLYVHLRISIPIGRFGNKLVFLLILFLFLCFILEKPKWSGLGCLEALWTKHCKVCLVFSNSYVNIHYGNRILSSCPPPPIEQCDSEAIGSLETRVTVTVGLLLGGHCKRENLILWF